MNERETHGYICSQTVPSHQINVADLNEWLGGERRWETYAISSGPWPATSVKKMEVYRRRGIYRVTVAGAIRYLGPRQETAIRFYNEGQ
jgi:hypothetical protein